MRRCDQKLLCLLLLLKTVLKRKGLNAMVRARKAASDAFPPGYLRGLSSLILNQSFQILPPLSITGLGCLSESAIFQVKLLIFRLLMPYLLDLLDSAPTYYEVRP